MEKEKIKKSKTPKESKKSKEPKTPIVILDWSKHYISIA